MWYSLWSEENLVILVINKPKNNIRFAYYSLPFADNIKDSNAAIG